MFLIRASTFHDVHYDATYLYWKERREVERVGLGGLCRKEDREKD